MVIETIDDGSPAYNPRTHHSIRTWVDEERTRETPEGPVNYTARVATYSIEPLPVTVDRIRTEAQRRIMALLNVDTIERCIIKQLNAQMRATELTLIKATDGSWTAEQAAEAATLQGLADAIKAIRIASNVLEASLPTDYADNSHWPT